MEQSTSKQLPGRSVFQFVPPFIIAGAALSALWGPYVFPYTFLALVITFLIYFMFFQMTAAWRFFEVYWNMRRLHSKKRIELPHQDRGCPVKHLIIIPNYKEKLSTLQNTLQQLASHPFAATHYIITLAQEETESDFKEKVDQLFEEFQPKFYKMYYTVHPAGVVGEVRGKGTNVCYSVKQMKRILVDEEQICKLEEVIVTLPDADSLLPEAYFQSVNDTMWDLADRTDREFFFVPIVAWAQNSLQVPILIRMCDAMYSIMYNQNLLGLFGIQFPYSTFGLPLALCHQVGYWDTGADAIGDELHMWLKCYFETRGRLRSIRIWAPVLVSNVETDTYWGTLVAKWRQSYRWFQGIHDLSFVWCNAILYRNQMSPFKLVLICARIFETLVLPMVIPFILFYIGVWSYLPFRNTPEIIGMARALQTVANVASGLGVFWFITYELFHHLIATHYAPTERRQWYRIFEWIIGAPSLFLMLAVPGIFVSLTRFTLKSAESFVYITAPKPVLGHNVEDV